MDHTKYSVGLVGAGYIAAYHAKALRRIPGLRLASVCDVSPSRAAGFAATHGIGGIYDSLDTMLANEALDAVHVVTPPENHASLGCKVLESDTHLFLEKPMCTEAADCDRLLELAEQHQLRLGVNHNFLFHPAYESLRTDVRSGTLGPLDHIAITWALELPQLKQGPFDMWALQDPTNILMEVGSHCLSQVLDLASVPDSIAVHPGNPLVLPGGKRFYQRWQITMTCGQTAVDVYLSFAPGFARRSVQASGTLGTATADLERNTYLLQRNGRYTQDFGKYELLTNLGNELHRQARTNLAQYVLSKCGLGRNGNAYARSIEQSIRTFYSGLRGTMDPRCSGQLGRQVVEQCARIAAMAEVQRPSVKRVARVAQADAPADVLVLGGTGFIGRELLRQLLKAGHTVRVMSRSRTLPFDLEDSRLQVVSGDIRNDPDIARAIEGVRSVYHLARSAGGSWKNYYEQDVLGTGKIAHMCLQADVERLVYTSSIVGYNLAGNNPITENTPFDPAILRQNKYARAKAEAERVLMEMHETRGLPVVIVRPGMVIGRGGDLCHGGLGVWNGLGSCVFWGDGRGLLPFVLVEDVARGLIAAMETPGIEGQDFNLIDDPCLSAFDYVAEIERFAGIRIQTFTTAAWKLLATDLVKWGAKFAMRAPERYVPNYRMWKGRMARACFDCSKAKDTLGWTPAADRDTLIQRGLHVHLVEHAGRVAQAPQVAHPIS